MDFEIGLNKNSFSIKTGQKLKEHRPLPMYCDLLLLAVQKAITYEQK